MNNTIRLLYVEDSPQDADLTQAHFAREAPDFLLESVATGASCLARLKTDTFDLLLLDNRLPDMDGLDVLGRLRASGQMLPVVMVTGVGDDDTVAKALRAGAADYVPKAVDYLATLPDLLRGVLKRQRQRQLPSGSDAQRVQQILYVEHNPMDVELTTSHFAANAPHLRLHNVASGPQALALLAPGHSFDLVLTDLRMPGMNALELIREAHRLGVDLPFIVITGRGDEATAVTILRLGAYDYIVKRDNYLMQLPHAIDHALQRFHLDQTTRYLNAELAALNTTLERMVEERTADLQREMEVRQASENRFRFTFEQAAVGIAHVAPDGSWLRVNQKLCDIVGYSREELLDRTFQDITHPDDLELDLSYVGKMLSGEISNYAMEKRYFRKDGEIVWINLTVSLVRQTDGSPDYFIAVVEDITGRKRVEAEGHLMLEMGKAIAEAESFISALDISIRTICESTGWDFGEAWMPSQDGIHLELGEPYYCKIEEMEGFHSASRRFKFTRGIGLPGRVWASGKPVWEPDVRVAVNFPRAPFARQAGIKAAVGIPILAGNVCVAVMVFFMGKVQAEDESMTALISSIAAQLGTAFQRKRDEEHIQWLANYDTLTGLPNRALFADRINRSISMSQRSNAQLAVMFLDLDHFKNINDSLGHLIGDRLLVAVAERMTSVVRDEDTVSRLGGDEFILLLQNTDANGAARVARKLLEAIARPYQIEHHELVVTPSIGIAMYPTDSEDFESLAKCADVAMYRAKQNGRNNLCFFTAEMQASSVRRLRLENALRHALEYKQLQLHYQPQLSLSSGHVIGAEALLRWQHPVFGMVSPAEFIPIAEDSGLILPIGEWVLRSAMRQLKAWMDSGMEPMVMAVNLSAAQFRQPHLPDLIMQILEEMKLLPKHLELELTESIAMKDPLAAVAIMDNLHQRGIHMAIDDFGTGYSSLNHLKRFHVYKLKIDQSFIHDITEDDDDKAIVSAIISMASSLGLRTIAEGVETDAQLAFLREKGCNEMQGYYFSKPVPAEQFEVFVRGRDKV